MAPSMFFKALIGLPLLAQVAMAADFPFDSENEFIVMAAMQDAFNENGVKGVFNGLKILGDLTFTFLEGGVRADLPDLLDPPPDEVVVLNQRARGTIERILANPAFVFCEIGGVDEDNFQNCANELINNQGNVGAAALDVEQDNALLTVSLHAVIDPAVSLAPSSWCVIDPNNAETNQCQGQRAADRFGPLTDSVCQQFEEGGVIVEPNLCNAYVAKFTLRWLLTLIIATYGLLVLWALYWIFPYMLSKCTGSKRGGNRGPARSNYSEAEQLICNTLASQCASAENLLLQATEQKKQAINLGAIVSVDAKRESKVLLYVVEYFQAVCAVMVNLTHQHLDLKAKTPGENYNGEDATCRALQLEVLNYVRDRIDLALNSDPMTEKSLYRIAEAYAVVKKISDSLVFVGFSLDRATEGSLGFLRTASVKFTEDAIFLGGVYSPEIGIAGAEQFSGQQVCFTLETANKRNTQPINASQYLGHREREAKIFDPDWYAVQPGVGKAMAFAPLNAAQGGEGLQLFVRKFWGNEIAAAQGEADRWLQVDNALESWLDQERINREVNAKPVVRRGARRRRKKRHGDSEYKEGDEKTEISDTTEATGWSVDPSNNFVFNVQSVVDSGLGIAGKPTMPYDKPGEATIKQGSKLWRVFEYYMPNVAEWPKFYFFIFVMMPFFIHLPWIVKIGQGGEAYDLDGNLNFKARVAGFGTSYLGVPNYYFLDGFVPTAGELIVPANLGVQEESDARDLVNLGIPAINPFGVDDKNYISNAQAAQMYEEDFNGLSGRFPEQFLANIQGGILRQVDVAGLDSIRRQQKAQEVTTAFLYGLMHTAAYFFGMVPLTLIRESLEIIARKLPLIRKVYPLSLWRELHMHMGLAAILFVAWGATVFLITQIISIEKHTPFSGNGGDPDIPGFFNFENNVLYIRMVLLPFVPLLFLMKYASRGPPRWMVRFCPTWITKNYWEICYFLHYFVALVTIITLVIYRSQVFYWMGTTWGVVWGGNKIVRLLRTRKCTIKRANLVSYKVKGKDNSMQRADVLRIVLNVPPSFPSSSRGQACWITCPNIDFVAHPFTLAKVPSEDDCTIMFHIEVRYLRGDNVIQGARPAEPAPTKQAAPVANSNPDALPEGWKSAVDPNSNQTYYYNSKLQQTTWEKPVVTGADRMRQTVRGLTTRISAAKLRSNISARFGGVGGGFNKKKGQNTTVRQFAESKRATWTQKFAQLAYQLETMDPELKRNNVKTTPIYVSAPLGISMDECLAPTLPGSIIITTQNGLPAAESSVRWMLKQQKSNRPRFHFFVSVSRQTNDALSILQALRDGMAESVAAGLLNVDGVNGRHAHMCDWLGVYINLTRRKPSSIEDDRDALMASLEPPKAKVEEKQLEVIDTFLRNRVQPGRLKFDRFLARTQQMVLKRTGMDEMAVGYCGSAKVAYSLRSACRQLPNVKFEGEYI